MKPTEALAMKLPIVRFTSEDLAAIARWEPIAPGFSTSRTVISHVQPILDRLHSERSLACSVVQDGGTANYFAFTVSTAARFRPGSPPLYRCDPCVLVYLSLLAPVGVFGRSEFEQTSTSSRLRYLGPGQVCDPDGWTTLLDRTVIEAVRQASCYELLGRQVIDGPLPEGIEVNEYCLCDKPWDRVFHVLFADTD
jgi:hypothetical protein